VRDYKSTVVDLIESVADMINEQKSFYNLNLLNIHKYDPIVISTPSLLIQYNDKHINREDNSMEINLTLYVLVMGWDREVKNKNIIDYLGRVTALLVDHTPEGSDLPADNISEKIDKITIGSESYAGGIITVSYSTRNIDTLKEFRRYG